MANLTFRIPDAMLPDLLDAVAENRNYQATLEDGTTNPVSKQKYGKQQIKAWMLEQYTEAQVAKTATEAAADKRAEIDAYIRDHVPADPD